MLLAEELILPVAESIAAPLSPFKSSMSIENIEDMSLTFNDRAVIQDLNDYAGALIKDNQIQVAIVILKRGLAMDRMVPELWANLGVAYYHTGDLHGAIKALNKAIALSPKTAYNYGNLALVYGALRQYDDADRCYVKVRELGTDQDKLNTTWDQSLFDIERGNWETGLSDYDVRMELKGSDLFPKFPAPMWKGEDLNGKTLYIAPEQGIGDRILFSRYFAHLKELWPDCRLITCVADKMINFFWEFRHIIEIVPHGIPWFDKEKDGISLDYASYLMSLPKFCGSTPTNVPPDPGLIYKRVKRQYDIKDFNCPFVNSYSTLKVGIAWTGSPNQARNSQRTMPLEKMLTLAENPQVALYSFQVGHGSDRIEEIGAQNIVFPLGPQLEQNGFVAAGVAMMHMDLIISVCTSTVHLAGAIGVPCWTLLCSDPYWIWLQDKTENKRTDTIWYPNMRLFHQDSPGDWDSVLKKVKPELAKLCREKLG